MELVSNHLLLEMNNQPIDNYPFYALQIQLEPSEVVLKLSGTIGAFGGIPNVVTSLTLVTSAGRYGPYGLEEGTAFHIPVRSNGRIVGFFAQSDWRLC